MSTDRGADAPAESDEMFLDERMLLETFVPIELLEALDNGRCLAKDEFEHLIKEQSEIVLAGARSMLREKLNFKPASLSDDDCKQVRRFLAEELGKENRAATCSFPGTKQECAGCTAGGRTTCQLAVERRELHRFGTELNELLCGHQSPGFTARQIMCAERRVGWAKAEIQAELDVFVLHGRRLVQAIGDLLGLNIPSEWRAARNKP